MLNRLIFLFQKHIFPRTGRTRAVCLGVRFFIPIILALEDMRLPTSAIEEFQAIWEQVSGETLNSKIAATQAQKLLLAVEAIFNDQSYGDTKQRPTDPIHVTDLKNKELRLQNEALPNTSE
jgi:hypothetical protein